MTRTTSTHRTTGRVTRVTRAALPTLRASDRAAVVNIGSIAATAGLPNRAVYGTTKGAVQALSLAMATDFLTTASG